MSSSCDSPVLIKPSRTTQKKLSSVFASMQKTRHDADYGANLIRCSVRNNPHQLLKPILECKTPIQMKQTLQIPLNESINLKWDEVVDYFKDPNQFRISSQTSINVDTLEVESQKLKELYFTKKVQKERKPKVFSMARYKRISKFLNSVKKPSSDKSIVSLKCIEECSQEQRIRLKSIQKILEFQQRIGLISKTVIQNEKRRKLSISEIKYEGYNIFMEKKHEPPMISSIRSIQKIQDFTGRVKPRQKTINYFDTQNQIPSELEVEKINHQIKSLLSNSVDTNQEYQGRINKKQKTIISIDTNISQSQITYDIKPEQQSTQKTVQVQEKTLISFTSKSVQPIEEFEGDHQKPKFCSNRNLNDKEPFSSEVKVRSTMAKQGIQKQKTIFSDTSFSRSHVFSSGKSEKKIQLYPGVNQNNSIIKVPKIGDQIEALTILQGLPQAGSQKKIQRTIQNQFRIQKWFV